MKKTFFLASVVLATIFLAGCADKADQVQTPVTNVKSTVAPIATPSPESQQNQPAIATPPATVSTQPGATPDEEIKNIDKDLQAIDDNAFDQGALSDTAVGL